MTLPDDRTVGRQLLWRKACSIAVAAALSCTGILTLVGFLNSLHYLADIAAHFRVQYLIVQLACLFVLLLCGRWKPGVVAASMVLLNVSVIAPLFLPFGHDHAPPGQARLRILQANVNARNDSSRSLIGYVRQKQPDVLLVVELSPSFLTQLSKELPDYPFRIASPNTNTAGIGLFSKIPMSRLAIECFGEVARPNVVGRFVFQGRDITFVGTHLRPPVNADAWREQKAEAEGIVAACGPGDSLILAGDFNSAGWTASFQQFLHKLNLVDTRVGFGLHPTWPTESPIARIPLLRQYHRVPIGVLNRLIMIPIDHFLISRDLVTIRREVGPYIGSDHYPVYIELGLPRAR